MAACLQRAYERQRDTWLSRLGGAAAEEATRPLDVHITLQRLLQQSAFLPSTEIVNGVYGPATRAAISAWQHANGRPNSGILSDADATILLAGPPAAPNAAPPALTAPPIPQSGGQNGRASWPIMDPGGDAGASPFSLSGLEAMAVRYWDRTGSGDILMALGGAVLLAGFGSLFRAPKRADGRVRRPARVSTTPTYSVGRYSSGGRAPQLMVGGLVIVLSGACVAYGPATIYQTVEQALTSVFA
jgi:peptidoglycan hydrolase-like protein with peptidoglycan-binding domain